MGYVYYEPATLASAANAVFLLTNEDTVGPLVFEATLDGVTWEPISTGVTTALSHTGTAFQVRVGLTDPPSGEFGSWLGWLIAYAYNKIE